MERLSPLDQLPQQLRPQHVHVVRDGEGHPVDGGIRVPLDLLRLVAVLDPLLLLQELSLQLPPPEEELVGGCCFYSGGGLVVVV